MTVAPVLRPEFDAELRAGASVLPARGVDQPFERR